MPVFATMAIRHDNIKWPRNAKLTFGEKLQMKMKMLKKIKY